MRRVRGIPFHRYWAKKSQQESKKRFYSERRKCLHDLPTTPEPTNNQKPMTNDRMTVLRSKNLIQL